MFLVNINPIRIHKYPDGWVVEIQKRKWYGVKYWTHLISVAGLPLMPWYFQTIDMAEKEAELQFSWALWYGIQHLN